MWKEVLDHAFCFRRLWGRLEREELFHPYSLAEKKMGGVRKRTDFLEFHSSLAVVELSENDGERDQCSPLAQWANPAVLSLSSLPPHSHCLLCYIKWIFFLAATSQPCSWCSILRSKMIKRGSYDLVQIAATLTSSTGALQNRNGAFLFFVLDQMM